MNELNVLRIGGGLLVSDSEPKLRFAKVAELVNEVLNFNQDYLWLVIIDLSELQIKDVRSFSIYDHWTSDIYKYVSTPEVLKINVGLVKELNILEQTPVFLLKTSMCDLGLENQNSLLRYALESSMHTLSFIDDVTDYSFDVYMDSILKFISFEQKYVPKHYVALCSDFNRLHFDSNIMYLEHMQEYFRYASIFNGDWLIQKSLEQGELFEFLKRSLLSGR